MKRKKQNDIYFEEILYKDGFDNSAALLHKAFKTVADEFSLTRENAATNATFIDSNKLEELFNRGVKLYGVFKDKMQIGFVAIEKANNEIYYMEKLAVIPELVFKEWVCRITHTKI